MVFHRLLRCLIVIDVKIGSFSHADAGQMHFYLNYARESWTREGENLPVGLMLCSEKDEALVRYSLDGLPKQVMVAEYPIALPDEEILVAELERTRQAIELRASVTSGPAPVSAKLSLKDSTDRTSCTPFGVCGNGGVRQAAK